jgi:hypothetical protein
MSKLTRTLIVGATLATLSLVGMTAGPQAQAKDDPDGKQAALRPPTERQVGEPWHKHPVTSQQETAADAAFGRVLARERFSIPDGAPGQVPAPAPTQPNGHRGWLIASLGVLAVTLVLAGGLAVLAVRRASRRAPPPAASPTR